MKNKWVWFFLMTWGFSQYTEEWQIAQDEYENGILFFDMNEDGYADITKIKEQLNFKPKTSLKEGLKKFKLWADQKYSKL